METVNKNTFWLDAKSIIIIILLVILLFLNKCRYSTQVEPTTKVTTKTKVDTVTVIKRDTVTRYVNLKVPTPVISIVPNGDTMQTYVQEYSDSILDATITATLKCKLDSWNFKYTPKIPTVITNTVTVTNTVTETKEVNVPKNMLFVNIVGVGNINKLDGGLGISFYHKKGYIYQLNYLPITKGIIGGASFQLNR